jgi:CRP/FNR family transcriptional regulator, cyclic AMP receptor protein
MAQDRSTQLEARWRDRVLALLSEDAVFGQLEAPQRASLAHSAQIEHYEVPTLLNAAGHPLGMMRRVLEGHIEIIARHVDGEEVALGDVGPGGWGTWVACLAASPPEHDFYSSADARFLALPSAVVRQVFQNQPALYPLVIAEIGVQLRQLMAWAGDSALLAPEQRMAKLIHLLANAHRIDGATGKLKVTQNRLARMARCSRQSANLLLRSLERRGLIAIGYGQFDILDMAALRAFIGAELPGAAPGGDA